MKLTKKHIKPVLLGIKDGKSVWALPSHELQLHDGTPGGTYNYIWSPTLCGNDNEH